MPSASDPTPLRGSRLSRQDLLEALELRDGQRLAVLSRRWAHRQGVEALHGLIHGPQIEETARLWWLEQLERPLARATAVVQLATPAPSAAPDTSTPEHAGITPEPAPDPSTQHPQAVSESAPAAAASVLPESTLLPGVSEDMTPTETERSAPLMPETASEPPAAPPSGAAGSAAAPSAEPLPPMAEVFGPIHGLEPLPSFNVAAIFAMQSELAEKPLAPPIIPPAAVAPDVEPPAPVNALGAPQDDDKVAAQPAPSEAPAPAIPAVMASPFEAILFPSQSPDAATAELPATPAATEAGAAEATGPQASGTEAPAPTPPRRNPFSRLRTLWQDCVDEVASTFRGEEPEVFEHHFDMADTAGAEPMPESSSAASPRPAVPASTAATATAFPSLFATQPAQEPAAERPSIAPPPFPLQQAPQSVQPAKVRRRRTGESAATAAQSTGKPAPAPSHPALDSLRSWLPDSLDQHDQRRAS